MFLWPAVGRFDCVRGGRAKLEDFAVADDKSAAAAADDESRSSMRRSGTDSVDGDGRLQDMRHEL